MNVSLDHSEGSLLSEDTLDTEDDGLDTGDDLDVNLDDLDTPDEADSLELNKHGDSRHLLIGTATIKKIQRLLFYRFFTACKFLQIGVKGKM